MNESSNIFLETPIKGGKVIKISVAFKQASRNSNICKAQQSTNKTTLKKTKAIISLYFGIAQCLSTFQAQRCSSYVPVDKELTGREYVPKKKRFNNYG